MISCFNAPYCPHRDNVHAANVVKLKNTEDYNYLDHLRWSKIMYYRTNFDTEAPGSSLFVSTLKTTHKSMMREKNPKVTDQKIANEWNEKLPNIPWDMN